VSNADDVVVIGGGAVGACAALELARQGAKVTLLERGPRLASGC
jgi:glycine/D-amino acid oxidase-like deaminating enzyme